MMHRVNIYYHKDISDTVLFRLLKQKNIVLGGNKNLKIYGTLHCRSGKRMKKTNRVFFTSEAEAISAGYRPCGHCMRGDYKIWKDGLI
ncbi:Ada metal-binding domain-containing protein [Spongiimicrobium sp. 3-5]|uniref:Ada metal-binding domain-containing protein n=1 Tax=Spongiimicrobium sp. 3-5 TaxID=3332596 RepID=UPI003980EC92